MNLSYFKKLFALLGVASLVAACELDGPDDNEQPDPIDEGVFVVDATSDDEWVHFDLDAAETTEDPALWELAFRRSWVVANRDAGVQVARMDDETLDGLEAAPETGYALDGDPSAADDPRSGGEGLVFHDGDDWFDYDMATHALSPKDRIYVVLSTEGRAYALQFAGFYDPAGTSGFVSFRYKEIAAPEDPEDPIDPEDPEDPEHPEDAITIDASAEDSWVYFDLDTTEVVDESADWELAFQRSTIVANGPAGAQVTILDGVSLDEVDEVPEEGFLVDPAIAEELDEAELAFHGESAWYAYDMETHQLSARERVYVVVNADSSAFAVQLLDYYDEEDQGGHPTFRVKALEPTTPVEPVEAVEVTIDASDEEAWVYYDLDAGEETSADADWELAFRRSTIVANGPAGAQVAILDGATLDEVTEAPEEGFLVDPAIAEEPDETELAFHGESAWYAYDMTTHSLSARERVYVVISSEGAAFAIQLIDYYDAESASGFPTFLYKEIE